MKRSLSALLALAALAGCGSAPREDPAPVAEHATVVAESATETPTATATATATARPARAARPVRLRIAAIRVDVPLVPLGLDRSGALEAPKRFDVGGWWSGGTRPGDRGPAVIAGHVDSKTGPAAFFELGRLRKGDKVVVQRADGTSVRFTVQGSGRYPKDRFPTKQVYGPTSRATLRLITCSGDFNHSTGHYLDNTVVYATT